MNGVQRGINYVYHLINKRHKSNDTSYFFIYSCEEISGEGEAVIYIYI